MSLEVQILEALRPVIREEVREEVAKALRQSGPRLLTTEQAAAEAGVSAKTIRAWIAQGLPAIRRGRRLLVAREALEAWGGEPVRPAAGLVSSLTGRGG